MFSTFPVANSPVYSLNCATWQSLSEEHQITIHNARIYKIGHLRTYTKKPSKACPSRQNKFNHEIHRKSILSSSILAVRTSWSVRAPEIMCCLRAWTCCILSSTVSYHIVHVNTVSTVSKNFDHMKNKIRTLTSSGRLWLDQFWTAWSGKMKE